MHVENAEKANLFNDFFANQSTDISSENDIAPSLPDAEIPTLNEIEITEDEVFKQLKALKINKSSGTDGIPNKIVKNDRYLSKRTPHKTFQ